MNAKLIKVLDQYHLYDGDKPIATTIVCNPMLLPILSIKNCQAIENGYDLEDLACDWHKNEYGFMPQLQVIKAYISGFQKALEILGDKKFSEKELKFNMLQLFYLEKNKGEEEAIFRERQLSFIEKSIQSLQKTEWDVEIITKPYTVVGEGFNLESKREPKLDADGCLILKRNSYGH